MPFEHSNLRPSTRESSWGSASNQQALRDRSNCTSSDVTAVALSAETDIGIEEREDADADAVDEIIMCIDMNNKDTVGCCYYVASNASLFVMADVVNGGVDIVDRCKLMAPFKGREAYPRQ